LFHSTNLAIVGLICNSYDAYSMENVYGAKGNKEVVFCLKCLMKRGVNPIIFFYWRLWHNFRYTLPIEKHYFSLYMMKTILLSFLLFSSSLVNTQGGDLISEISNQFRLGNAKEI